MDLHLNAQQKHEFLAEAKFKFVKFSDLFISIFAANPKKRNCTGSFLSFIILLLFHFVRACVCSSVCDCTLRWIKRLKKNPNEIRKKCKEQNQQRRGDCE